MERTQLLQLQVLKETQGIHAPLRLMMEREAASRVSRLPFLPSSGLMLDVLTGRDEDLGPETLFNSGSEAEAVGSPFLVMQRSLGLL